MQNWQERDTMGESDIKRQVHAGISPNPAPKLMCWKSMCEAWLIRKLRLSTIVNQRHGGAGRPLSFDEIGADFVLVGE